MKYRPKAKLKVSQVKDLRTSGAVRRRTADMTPDGAEKPISVEQAEADNDWKRYNRITYSKPFRPVGHIRPMYPKVSKKGGYELRSERPDGADRTQPFKNKHKGVIARDQAHPKKLRVKRTGTSH